MPVYKNDKGKWYARGSVLNQRYHRLLDGAKNCTEANILDTEIRHQITLEQRGLAHKIELHTFEECIKLFEEYSRQYKRDYYHDKSKIRLIRKYFKSKKVENITAKEIMNFTRYLMTEVPNPKTGKQGLSKASVNRYLSTLSKIFSLAISEKYIVANPIKNIKSYTEDTVEIHCLTKEEEAKLLDELKEPYKSIVIFALKTALRRANILKMKWSYIHLDERYIKIPSQVAKGKKDIEIPICDSLYELLKKMPYYGSEYVFINPKTNLPFGNIHKSFTSACKRAGLKNFRFHDLRHTVATRLVNSNVNIRNVQKFLGHSSIKTTERYLHPTQDGNIMLNKLLDS